ncbi:MAG TPA: hypothetical protein PK082_07660 [Phycisphaerae bacterium]|nr:hypothetical protein [Phycisphaerae bacterium]
MRPNLALTLALLVVVAVGCEAQDRQEFNAWLLSEYQDPAMNNAIIRQHTLFPYHFVADSAELTELGHRDLDLLATHFAVNTGQLNVRRGDAPGKLYALRVQRVKELLAQGGVPVDRIRIDDDLPGGDGMPSEQVVKITQGDTGAKPKTSTYMTSGGASAYSAGESSADTTRAKGDSK